MFVISCKEIGVTSKIWLAPIFVCILSGAKIIYRDVIYLTNNDYINSFPQILKLNNFEANKIAITEAGRFPFWYDAQEMIDLVGLNSIRVVKEGSAQVLNDTKPNLIFIHHAGRFDMSEFESDKPFFITNPKSIKIKTEYMGKNSVLIAPESALNYAIENKFIAIPVRYGSEDANFSHVYFLSPILNKKLFIAALEQSWKIKLTYHQSNHN